LHGYGRRIEDEIQSLAEEIGNSGHAAFVRYVLEADIAVRTVRPTHGDFIVRQAGVWNCAVYVSRDYAAKRNLKPGLNDFRDIDVITWAEENTFRGGDWFDEHARGAPVVFAANSRHIQYAACKASLGAAILPCLAADHDPDLVQLLPPERVRSINLWLVAHNDLVRTARVRAVLDFIADIVPRRTQSGR
jgi:DNA-binding transcriptional LysR family regulator